MLEQIEKIREAWEEEVELRNAYTFGDEIVPLEEFAGLFKDTFEIIRTAKNDFIFKRIAPKDARDALDYLGLLTVLSKYCIYDCTDDESEDKAFTATCLVAQKLVEYATSWGGGRKTEDGGIEGLDYEEERQGSFTFYRDDYPFYDEEESEGCYTYNVYEADFAEVLELAATI